jgi:energy-coupling factor transporter ATP-binding protein EcfA2
MSTHDLGLQEVQEINSILKANRVAAHATLAGALAVRSSFIGYPLELERNEKQARVAGLLREMGNAIYAVRRRLLPGYSQPTPVRLREFPYALEVPYPNPQPLPSSAASIRAPRYHALIGRWYEFGQQPAEQYLDLERDYHTLVAAMSGAGKSTLMRMMLLTLLANTSSEQLQVVVVDLKNDDFPVFRTMPQVITFAGDPASDAGAVAMVDAELRRRIETGARTPRLLLLIDELAQLRTDRQTMSRIADILNMGRAMAINVWAGTQYPNKDTITTEINVAFTTRLVGRVDGPNAATVATKRAASGAHLLAVPGDFLRIDADVRRIKAYNLSQAETAEMVAFWRKRWGSSQPAAAPLLAVAPPTPTAPTIDPRLAEIAATIAPLLADGASQNEMIRAVFGPGANTGGSNLAWIKRARAHLESLESTTTTVLPAAEVGDLVLDRAPMGGSSSSSSERVWM